MSYYSGSSLLGSNTTNIPNSFGITNSAINSYGHWSPFCSGSNSFQSTSNAYNANSQMNPFGMSHGHTTYPPYSTSNWPSVATQSCVPTYTLANQSLITSTTYSQPIPTSSSVVFTPSRAESTMDRVNQRDNCKEDFKLLINQLKSIQESNEKYQNSLLNELKQVKQVLIDLKCLTSDLPNRFSDALSNSFASIRSRSNSISIDSEAEIVEILDNIDLSKSSEFGETQFDDSNLKDSDESELILNENKESVKEKLNDNNSPRIDKFVFPYDSTIDMNKWLKKD